MPQSDVHRAFGFFTIFCLLSAASLTQGVKIIVEDENVKPHSSEQDVVSIEHKSLVELQRLCKLFGHIEFADRKTETKNLNFAVYRHQEVSSEQERIRLVVLLRKLLDYLDVAKPHGPKKPPFVEHFYVRSSDVLLLKRFLDQIQLKELRDSEDPSTLYENFWMGTRRFPKNGAHVGQPWKKSKGTTVFTTNNYRIKGNSTLLSDMWKQFRLDLKESHDSKTILNLGRPRRRLQGVAAYKANDLRLRGDSNALNKLWSLFQLKLKEAETLESASFKESLQKKRTKLSSKDTSRKASGFVQKKTKTSTSASSDTSSSKSGSKHLTKDSSRNATSHVQKSKNELLSKRGAQSTSNHTQKSASELLSKSATQNTSSHVQKGTETVKTVIKTTVFKRTVSSKDASQKTSSSEQKKATASKTGSLDSPPLKKRSRRFLFKGASKNASSLVQKGKSSSSSDDDDDYDEDAWTLFKLENTTKSTRSSVPSSPKQNLTNKNSSSTEEEDDSWLKLKPENTSTQSSVPSSPKQNLTNKNSSSSEEEDDSWLKLKPEDKPSSSAPPPPKNNLASKNSSSSNADSSTVLKLKPENQPKPSAGPQSPSNSTKKSQHTR